MKTRVSVIILLLCLAVSNAGSQIPQGFNYQALALDDKGVPLAGEKISVKLTFLSDTTLNVIIWEEIHGPLNTTQNGMFSIVAGTGERTENSAVARFSDINWNRTDVFIRTGIHYKEAWITMGQAKLWSVPYAMLAADLGGAISKLEVAGMTDLMDEALFEVRNKLGNVVFAVYNEGVRVNIGDGEAKSSKGGFAIGTLDEVKGTQTLMAISADSIRMYINDDPLLKSVKGGFAIGGFDAGKGFPLEYLRVTDDSTRVYVHPVTGKSAKGGFAIGSYDESKATVYDFMDITPDNYFFGHQSGMANVSGLYNLFMGFQSGMGNVSGDNNVFLGYKAGEGNLSGKDNIFIGNGAGKVSDAYSNIFIGQSAGNKTTDGSYNIFMGEVSGYNNTTGGSNIFLGYEAGVQNIGGSDNIYIGPFCANSISSGNANVIIGMEAATGKTSGSENVIVGSWSGGSAAAGSGNVFIGTNSGEANNGDRNVFIGYGAGSFETGSEKLYIESKSAGTPLIGGDFNLRRVGINRMPTTYTLEVNGQIWANGEAISHGAVTWSDERYKQDISQLDNALEVVSRLRGVTYNWRQADFPEMHFTEGRQIGFIAQEVEKVYPDLVFTDQSGYKAVSYEKVTPLLLEAIKDQQKQINELRSQVEALLQLLSSREGVEKGNR